MSRRRTPVDFARGLRRESTEAEKALWALLRDRRLAGFKFRRQRPIGPYVADFVTLAGWLIIEVDGLQHAMASEVERDEQRTRYLESKGFTVLRFGNGDVLTKPGEVVETIYAVLGAPAHAYERHRWTKLESDPD